MQDAPQAVSMSFQREYAERYDWLARAFKDLAFSFYSSFLYYKDYDVLDEIPGYYTGGANGVDCWAAQIVLSLRERNPALKLHCILPHKGQADKWSDSERGQYYQILEQSNSVEYLGDEYYDGCMIDPITQHITYEGLPSPEHLIH